MDRKHHCSSLMRAVASNMLIWNGGNTVLEDISSRRRQHFKLTGCLQAKSEGARSNWDAALASKDRLLQQLEEKLEAEQSNCQQLRKGLAEAQHREEVASGRAEELAKRAAEAQHWQAKAEVRPRRAAFVRAPGSTQHLSLAPPEAAIRTRAGQTDSCWHEHSLWTRPQADSQS